MWKNFGLVVFTGGAAGSVIGIIEAMTLLLGVGAGEYDALLWGGIGYAILGSVMSLVGCLIAWQLTPLNVFVTVFVFVLTTLSWWVFEFHIIWLPLSFLLSWVLKVLVDKTPLRVLLTPKGAMGVSGLWLVLLLTFSLTPSKGIYLPPVHRNSAEGKSNILLIMIDGLPDSLIRGSDSPRLTSLAKSAWRFNNAFSNSPDRFGGTAALFVSETKSLVGPLDESMETLAERLAYEGYHTHGMVSHLDVGRFSNLHQGFDRFRYIPPMINSEILRVILGNEGTQHLKLTRNLMLRFTPQRRPTSDVVRLFQNDLRRDSGSSEPWFGWLHLVPLKNITQHEHRLLEQELGALIEMVRGDTIVVLTAPFQYSEGEGYRRLPVPLYIWVPGSVNREINNNVMLSDLPTTLTSLVGVPSSPSWMGRNVLRLPPMQDQHVIEVSHPDWVWRQQGKWRWIRHHAQESLYNVATDPNMNINVLEQQPQVLERIRKK